METVQLVLMKDRKHRLVPIDKIRVLNSRNREKTQFDDNIRSIGAIGLLKPIVVNRRHLEKKGFYELVCGEGRYLAFKALKRTHIMAQVVDWDDETALLCSLAENIARVPPNTMWYAREMKRMRDCGLPIPRICQIVGKTETYVVDYIRLVELGEERLIRGVEQGLFPISFATIVAKSTSGNIQRVLMDAFDSGLINSGNACRIKEMIELRVSRGKTPGRSTPGTKPAYSLKELRRDITKATEEKESFVREGKGKENRLLDLLDALGTLEKDGRFTALVRQEGLGERPVLVGKYVA